MEETTLLMQPFYLVLQLLSAYGWVLVGVAVGAVLAWRRLDRAMQRWRQARHDADHHKETDGAPAREQAVRQARLRQQERLQQDSERALQREEQKRAAAQRAPGEADRAKPSAGGYLPLSGGSAGGYRAPKRSACGGGGCGR